MTDTAYLKLCVRVADLPDGPVVPSVKRRCIACGHWVWSDPRADLPQHGTAIHVCEHCLPAVIENHLAESDEGTCP